MLKGPHRAAPYTHYYKKYGLKFQDFMTILRQIQALQTGGHNNNSSHGHGRQSYTRPVGGLKDRRRHHKQPLGYLHQLE